MIELWKNEDIYLDGDKYYSDLIQSIRNAKKSIHVEMYIWDKDRVGINLFQEVERMASKGVIIYIILDGIGSHDFIQYLQENTYHSNIKIKVYHPHPFSYSHALMRHPLSFMMYLIKRLSWINRRNHRKIIVIDEEIVYSGTLNISENHSSHYRSNHSWLDIGLRFSGTYLAKRLVLETKKVWSFKEYLAYKKTFFPHLKNREIVKWVEIIKGTKTFEKSFFYYAKKTKKRIWLTTGYFLPNKKIIRKLKKCLDRGVEVKIIVSRRSDVFYYNLLQRYFFRELLLAGAQIYLVQEKILHQKNYFFDNEICVGSSNLNYRSLFHDLEVNFYLKNENNKKILEENFLKLEKESKILKEEDLNKLTWIDRLLMEFFYLFRYWS